tara:strand:- start:333 stop:479 length:147 start_codon:yes stop_codon:yes gene_type:complete
MNMTNKEKAPSSQEKEEAASPVYILVAQQGIKKSSFLKLWMSQKRVSK